MVKIKIKYLINISIVILILWVQEMTASSLIELKRVDSFFLIFIPLFFMFKFLVKNILMYFHEKIKNESIKINMILASTVIFCFLLVSFTEKIQICYLGDCQDGYGVKFYKSSGKGDMFGLIFTNRITWYDHNRIEEIYEGEFENGQYNGNGKIYSINYDYDFDNHRQLYVENISVDEGKFKNGILVERLHGDSIYRLNQDYSIFLLNEFNLDKYGYRNKMFWK